MAELRQFMDGFLDASDVVTAHTSGSTGTPKQILLKKSDMRASARATNAFFGIGTDSLLCSALSVDYIAGKMMAVRALEANCRLVCLTPSNTPDISAIDNVIDLMAVTPSQIPALLQFSDLSERVRNLLIGGAPLPPMTGRMLLDSGVKAWLSYGMTETCSHVALAPLTAETPLYRAMPGITFAADADGRLRIMAPAFSFGELATNDVVELIDCHTFRWIGRADNAINSGGIKLHPEVLERQFGELLPTVAFYLTSEPHPLWGSALVMVIEGSETDADAARAVLDNAIADRRTLPKRYIAVAKLPRTASMKILRLNPSQL